MVWPTHLIYALIVPPTICSVGLKGLFGIAIISGVTQCFHRPMNPYLPYSTYKSQYIMTMVVWERKNECSTLEWDCRHDFFFTLFFRKISFFLVLEVKNSMKLYFPVKYQVLCQVGFPLNSERCFWAVKRTFIEIFFDKISKYNFLRKNLAKFHYCRFLFDKKTILCFLRQPGT